MKNESKRSDFKKRLYYGGSILTMEKDCRADYLLCEKGKILLTGHGSPPFDIEAEKIDLKGKALLPAFIDSHSHIFSYGLSLLQLSLEGAENFEDILCRLEEYIQKKNPQKGTWIQANGYDHTTLREKRHITAAMLDRVSARYPVVLHHKSGHMGIFNTAALQAFHIDEKTPSMEGGRIEIANGRPTGYLEEADFISRIKTLPLGDEKEIAESIKKAQENYASCGITTAQEGLLVRQLSSLYKKVILNNRLFLDIVGYAAVEDYPYFINSLPLCEGIYSRRFKIGGVKIFLDGSPQGRTAWMKTPYKKGPRSAYYGYPSMNDQKVYEAITFAKAHHTQLLAHCNGDMAAAQYLACLKKSASDHADPTWRPVIIHGQLLSPDQLPLVREIGAIPSYFNAHVYYWGDIHIENFGLERASQISPAASTASLHIPFTLHRDTPVLNPDLLQSLWCACRRITKNGVLLGEAERLSAAEGLKALTLYGAFQYGEEKEKGSLLPGKKEDLVLLSHDPLTVPSDFISQIKVLQTVKEGKTIYKTE